MYGYTLWWVLAFFQPYTNFSLIPTFFPCPIAYLALSIIGLTLKSGFSDPQTVTVWRANNGWTKKKGIERDRGKVHWKAVLWIPMFNPFHSTALLTRPWEGGRAVVQPKKWEQEGKAAGLKSEDKARRGYEEKPALSSQLLAVVGYGGGALPKPSTLLAQPAAFWLSFS